MNPQEIQAAYYNATADTYDTAHRLPDPHLDDNAQAMRFIDMVIRDRGITSALDVGCGTGYGVRHILDNHTGVRVLGVEPVDGLREQATTRHNIPPHLLCSARGEALPFASASFDAVFELGILHHVEKPDEVVREMCRVAKSVVFISDANRFGQGRMVSRIIKLLLWKLHLWKLTNLIKTRGKGYHISPGDGLFYSYSVYDSLHILTSWADRIILVPIGAEHSASWFHPLLTSPQVLVCAIKLK